MSDSTKSISGSFSINEGTNGTGEMPSVTRLLNRRSFQSKPSNSEPMELTISLEIPVTTGKPLSSGKAMPHTKGLTKTPPTKALPQSNDLSGKARIIPASRRAEVPISETQDLAAETLQTIDQIRAFAPSSGFEASVILFGVSSSGRTLLHGVELSLDQEIDGLSNEIETKQNIEIRESGEPFSDFFIALGGKPGEIITILSHQSGSHRGWIIIHSRERLSNRCFEKKLTLRAA